MPPLLEEGEKCLADLVGPHWHASLGGRSRCLAALAGILAVGPASASAANPCPVAAALPVDGRIGVPDRLDPVAQPAPRGSAATPARSCAPPTCRYPGPRPVVVIQHGLGRQPVRPLVDRRGPRRPRLRDRRLELADRRRPGARRSSTPSTRCARRSPSSAGPPTRTPRSATARGSALGGRCRWARSSPASSSSDPDPAVQAAIALDTLRRRLTGDPGGAVGECIGNPGVEVTPRVPALGFAKDEPCNARPDHAPARPQAGRVRALARARDPGGAAGDGGLQPPRFRRSGPTSSSGATSPTSSRPGTTAGCWTTSAALERLFADSVGGRPIESLLSTRFLSGAAVAGVDTDRPAAPSWPTTVAPRPRRCKGPTAQGDPQAGPARACGSGSPPTTPPRASSAGSTRASGPPVPRRSGSSAGKPRTPPLPGARQRRPRQRRGRAGGVALPGGRVARGAQAIVARPTTTSPASRHAVWPGATP